MSQLVKLATCNLNQWALDFDGNLARVKESIRQAKRAHCRFRLGPELEIPGYGCEDHFLELDTIWHSWDCLCELLTELDEDAGDGKKELLTANILCDIGMPVLHRDVIYNCRVYVLDGKILGIRPKMYLANDGNYRETRWFTEWHGDQTLETYYLPPRVLKKLPTTHPRTVPIGIFVLRCNGCVLGAETCEELFTPNSPHITMSLDGVHIITNGSGSHHQLRKLKQRVDLIRSATEKSGGIYLYANQLGCDGGRCFYDGCAMIWENGNLVAQGSQFGLKEVEVQTGVVDVNEVRSFRASFKSRSVQASLTKHKYPRVDVDFDLSCTTTPPQKKSPFREVFLHTPMEEIAFGPSAWLWDYLLNLRRSKQRGYFLPLSGGMDSSSTALLVGIMAQRVYEEVRTGRNPTVLRDLREIVKNANFLPSSGQDVCRQLFFTCYMASQYSGAETRRRAQEVSELIGANHCSICIDKVTDAVQEVFADMTMEVAQNENDSAASSKAKPLRVKKPDINSSGVENIALQNIQARSRMVMSYFLAQLLPWQVQAEGDAAKKVWPGQLLVLGSANVDEALRGYYTKYDCSAADINPIGGIKKVDLKAFLLWGHENYGAARNSSVLRDTAVAEPSAELTGSEGDQKDEVDMGMSYRELGDLGFARKCERAGPYTTFEKLVHRWRSQNYTRLTPSKRNAQLNAQSAALSGSNSKGKGKNQNQNVENLKNLPSAIAVAASTGFLSADRPAPASSEDKTASPPPSPSSSARMKKQEAQFVREVAQKVKDFYFYNAINRHKMTTLTPAYHAENYSPEDNRFDLRPFLYPAGFARQFRAIDEGVEKMLKEAA